MGIRRGCMVGLVVFIGGFVLLIGANYAIFALSNLGKPHEADLERQLLHDLPAGSSAAQVEAWYRAQGYSYVFEARMSSVSAGR